MRISDWSSDVCSSDLVHDENGDVHPDERDADEAEEQHEAARPQIGEVVEDTEPDRQHEAPQRTDHADEPADRTDGRSEARSVGKEWVRTCRSRWWPSP